jgi:hypothetical protein
VEVRSSEGLGRSAVCKPKLARLSCQELDNCSKPDGRVRLSAANVLANRFDSTVWKTGIGLLTVRPEVIVLSVLAWRLIVAQLFALEYETALGPFRVAPEWKWGGNGH